MHDIRPFLSQPFTDPGTLLYIGARADAHSWLDELLEAGNEVTVLEVWQPNIIGLREDSRIANLVQGDVREAVRLFIGQFDYVFWWHGPEHLEKQEIKLAIAGLEVIAVRLVALACPYGLYPQDAAYGNPYERHLATLYPAFFQAMGYNVRTDGKPDQAGSEIVAWKVFE